MNSRRMRKPDKPKGHTKRAVRVKGKLLTLKPSTINRIRGQNKRHSLDCAKFKGDECYCTLNHKLDKLLKEINKLVK